VGPKMDPGGRRQLRVLRVVIFKPFFIILINTIVRKMKFDFEIILIIISKLLPVNLVSLFYWLLSENALGILCYQNSNHSPRSVRLYE